MKVIKYFYMGNPVETGWNEINEEMAKKEADGGRYTVEESADKMPEPTMAERVEALENAVLEMMGVYAQ